MGSVAKGEDYGRCENCEASGPLQYGVCGRCHDLILGSAPAPEEKFAELFKAARALLNEGIGEEGQIIPTLAFAAWSGPALYITSAWRERLVKASGTDSDKLSDQDVDAFLAHYSNLRPVRLVDGVLILERLPVSIEIKRCYPNTEDPRAVWIHVYLHNEVAEPEHVAYLYHKALSEAGIRYASGTEGSFHFEWDLGVLSMMVGRGLLIDPLDERDVGYGHFPHPHFVEVFYRALLGTTTEGGFVKLLRIRQSGPAPNSEALILASVAHYLKTYRALAKGRKYTLALLNDHVLSPTGRESLPIGYSTGKTNQLWRDKNHRKVRTQLANVEHALWKPRGPAPSN
jgi:hypothetical protein